MLFTLYVEWRRILAFYSIFEEGHLESKQNHGIYFNIRIFAWFVFVYHTCLYKDLYHFSVYGTNDYSIKPMHVSIFIQ